MRNMSAILGVTAILALAGCSHTEMARQSQPPRAFVVYFQNGTATLTPEAQQIVDEVADAARHSERSEVIVAGVTDRRADQALTARRTAAVEAALRREGVAETMVSLRSSSNISVAAAPN
jgi:outer membrane protein OmpA-like peptidoglycan-associated protein